MNKVKRILITLILLFTLTLVSCKKKETKIDPIELSSVSDLQVSEDYILTFNTVNYAESYVIQIGTNKYETTTNEFDLKTVLTIDGLYNVWVGAKTTNSLYSDSPFTQIKVQYESYNSANLKEDLVNKYSSHGETKTISDVEELSIVLSKTENTTIKLSDTPVIYDVVLSFKYNENQYASLKLFKDLGYSSTEMSIYLINILEYELTDESEEEMYTFVFSTNKTDLSKILSYYIDYLYSIIGTTELDNIVDKYETSEKSDDNHKTLITDLSEYLLITNPIPKNTIVETRDYIYEILDYAEELEESLPNNINIIIQLIKDMFSIYLTYEVDSRIFINELIYSIVWNNNIDNIPTDVKENISKDVKDYYLSSNSIDNIVSYIYKEFNKEDYEVAVTNIKNVLNKEDFNLIDDLDELYNALGLDLSDYINYIDSNLDDIIDNIITKDNIDEALVLVTSLNTVIQLSKSKLLNKTYGEFLDDLASISSLKEDEVNTIKFIKTFLGEFINLDEKMDEEFIDSIQKLLKDINIKLTVKKIEYLK